MVPFALPYPPCSAQARVPDDESQAWLQQSLGVFHSALTSLVNRDHPDPAVRDGIMSADSSRTLGGSEITTYDSLDTSLGQARDNLYLGGKTWAAYVLLEKVLTKGGKQARVVAGSGVGAGAAVECVLVTRTGGGRDPPRRLRGLAPADLQSG